MYTRQRTIIKNKDLNTSSVKQMIVKYTYDLVNDSASTKPINITKMSDITNIRDKDYIACPKYFGERSWMIFVKLNGCYYAVTFLKQHRRNNINSIVLMSVEIPVNEEMYNGTIMEGIYSVTGGIITFIIDEIYYLAGKLQLLKPKDDRLKDLANYACTKFGGNPNYNVRFCHHYQIDKKSLESFYDKIKSDNTIQEIMFYPKKYGDNVYSYMITGEDLVDQVVRISIFTMKKTKQPDAYDLIDITTGNKVDIAIIPDIQTSQKCKKWFSTNKTTTLIVKCKYLFDKKKWLPIEICDE
uniref:mRNA capping enzyme adenylation domain-containing protein n=1 Tax=viral metagenome TaxID=1070528 RepID=A0A6C0CBD0_9ZZZZ